jgi:uncharacterized membrane protein
MEERMLAHARANGAPRMDRAPAAQALGADSEQLDNALTGRADDAQDQRTRTGLRQDQAAATLSVLTDGQLVSVINAPAGSGKTRVLAEAARIWTEAGLGPVIGITASQSALATGELWLFLAAVPANLCMCFLFARTASGPNPLVARLAAYVVALRQPATHYPGLHRFFQGATWLWAGIFLLLTADLAVLMVTEPTGMFLTLSTAATGSR